MFRLAFHRIYSKSHLFEVNQILYDTFFISSILIFFWFCYFYFSNSKINFQWIWQAGSGPKVPCHFCRHVDFTYHTSTLSLLSSEQDGYWTIRLGWQAGEDKTNHWKLPWKHTFLVPGLTFRSYHILQSFTQLLSLTSRNFIREERAVWLSQGNPCSHC